MQSGIFYSAIISFSLGIASGLLKDFSLIFIIFTSLITLIIFLFPIKFSSKLNLKIIFCLSILSFTIGIFRAEHIALSNFRTEKEISATARIISEPDVREKNTKYIIKILDKESDGKIYPNILMTTDTYPRFSYGDTINISGTLKSPENFENEQGKEFDYIMYLKKSNIEYILVYPEITLAREATKFSLHAFLYNFKKLFTQKISEIFPSPHAELLNGLLLGTKQALGQTLLDNFRRVGLIHIVVLSGFNITLIGKFVEWILSPFRRNIRIIGAIIFIILFGIMVGGGATVVRACVMAIISLLALSTYTNYNVNRALFLAAGLMILQNPLIILYDPSFQLSFTATYGLINLGNFFSKHLSFLTEKAGFKEIVCATLSTQIATSPLIIYMTGEISIVALLVNVIVLPVIPFTMLFGFISALLGFIHTFVAFPFQIATYFLLQYELLIVKIFSGLSFATFSF